MTIEDKLLEVQKILDKTGNLKAVGIHRENMKPHQFVVSDKHIQAAAIENEGVMTEEILERFTCNEGGCKLKYSEHIADDQLVLQLKKDTKKSDVANDLNALQNVVSTCKIRSLAFADTEEGYKFLEG